MNLIEKYEAKKAELEGVQTEMNEFLKGFIVSTEDDYITIYDIEGTLVKCIYDEESGHTSIFIKCEDNLYIGGAAIYDIEFKLYKFFTTKNVENYRTVDKNNIPHYEEFGFENLI